jgi:hypothetical protein
MRSVILYHLYPKNNWREVTHDLLSATHHDSVFVSVSLDFLHDFFTRWDIERFLKTIPKVKNIFFTKNSRQLSEVSGFNRLKNELDFSGWDVVTYLHSKGVTKPDNQCIKDWVQLMRYFVVERHDMCLQAFENGFALYGCNLGVFQVGSERVGPYRFSDFHYSGNFVSINLNLLRKEFLSIPCDNDYYGVEGFWGKLCPVQKAYNAHDSGTNISNHYKERYPSVFYKS